ncbi:hypothetical protein [Nocardia rhizosphaerae]|uniref:Lipoprotein n=1 Tax=Nocardia rhizosphaerae TaxID=1691571 RepID=A0ABV8L2W4_9NOCA
MTTEGFIETSVCNRGRSRALGALAFVAVVAVGGCGGGENADEPVSPGAPASDAADGGTPFYIVDVEVGEPFNISNADGRTGIVTLHGIEIEPECSTDYGTVDAAEGTFVALDMELETTANPPTKYISSAWFDEETPDGYTRATPSTLGTCIADRDGFRSDPNPNSKYRGWVLVDVSNPASTLLMSDIWDGRSQPMVYRIPLR